MARTAADGAPLHAAHSRHGERLREARRAAGLRQKDLADLLGVSQVAVSLMETGQRSVYPRRHAIAAVLGESWDTPAAEEKTVPPGCDPGGHPAGPITNGEEQMDPQQQNSRPRLAAPASNAPQGVQA